MPPGRPKAEPKELPVYDSISQCNGATGIPISVLRHAKKAGCDAFSSNRIYLNRLLRWLFSKEGTESNIDWGDEVKKWKAKREKLRYEKDHGVMVERDLVTQAFRRTGALMDSLLNQKLGNEYPTLVTKLDVAGARVYGKRLSDEIMVKTAEFYKEWEI